MNEVEEARVLRQEILGLFDRIQRIRREIASIRKPGESQDRFASMSDELDAIVISTESATNTIMENVESIDEAIIALRETLSDPDSIAKLDRIPDHIGAIFEACSFQDITGQRITKVVNTLQFIEKRVNALIEVWGESALSDVEPRDDREQMSPNDERRLLNGPQLPGHATSQSDIDAIMNGGDAQTAKAGDAAPPKAPPAPPAPPSRPASGSSDASASAPEKAADGKQKAPPKASPAPPPAESDGTDSGGLDQNDIDKLFG